MSRNGYSKLPSSLAYDDYEDMEADQPRKKRKPKSPHGSGEKKSLIAPNKNKNVYVFPDGTVSEHEDETIELSSLPQKSPATSQRSYKSTRLSQHSDVIIKEIPLTKTDTLHGIAIKFRCSVSEIKKINGFYTDQEFYGFTSLKIPVHSHQSLLHQKLEETARERQAAGDDLVASTKEASEEEDSIASGTTGAQSLTAMMQLRTDPDDEEAYALLDRQPHHNQHSNSSKRDIGKFNKLINKKDEELRELAEKVQQQANGNEVITSLQAEASQLSTYRRRNNCLSTLSPSLLCIVTISIIVFAAMIAYAVHIYLSHHNSGHA
ncbi:lysM and putative peptidoglycan-binding domain-containing protein 3-like isoform X2 [Watersipora subatra]|uniref:lysM and putative peptidoglycan-binding domain-containing protein 3-like isoform X2 n=1 Tax=Watersipora subatra TaxID=2589382 RepID=UPI00355B1DDE